jgi:hypothetical protein
MITIAVGVRQLEHPKMPGPYLATFAAYLRFLATRHLPPLAYPLHTDAYCILDLNSASMHLRSHGDLSFPDLIPTLSSIPTPHSTHPFARRHPYTVDYSSLISSRILLFRFTFTLGLVWLYGLPPHAFIDHRFVSFALPALVRVVKLYMISSFSPCLLLFASFLFSMLEALSILYDSFHT